MKMQGTSRPLHMKMILGITLGVSILTQPVMASQLCAEVLKSPSAMISQADIQRTIEDIARFKMSADLEKASGAGSQKTGKNISTNLYKSKVAELVARLNGTKSESEIKADISKKISELQNNVEDQKKATASRESQEKLLTKYIYDKDFAHTERISLPYNHKLESPFLEYVPKLDSLLVVMKTDPLAKVSQLQISLLDLRTQEFKKFFDPVKNGEIWNLNTSTNGRFFSNWAHASTGENKVFIFDTVTAKQTQLVVDSAIAPLQGWLVRSQEISPSGQSMLAVIKQNPDRSKEHLAYLIDTATGKVQPLEPLQEQLTDPRKVAFINEHEVIFVNTVVGDRGVDVGYELHRYNLVTGQTELLHKTVKEPFSTLSVDRESKNIFITELGSSRKVIRIKLDSTPFTPDKMSLFETPDTWNQVLLLPHSGLLVDTYDRKADIMTTIEGRDMLTGKFIHPEAGEHSNEYNSTVATTDLKNERLFVGYKPRYSPGTGYIDIWKAQK
jgi:hypothetical protein